eukprot:Skav231029  [mRNA]  locus=scaffold1869:189578:194323:- [translate_table: standard]
MASQARQRKGKVPNNPPEIDVDLPESSVARFAMAQPTPRSTLGSPLTSHATYKRSGVGDLGAGPRRHISLSQVELVPWLCCMAPAIALFATYFTVLLSVLSSTFLAEMVTAVLTFITWLWISNLSLASFAGVFKMRQAQGAHGRAHEVLTVSLSNLCGDAAADALGSTGLLMDKDERSWTIWQPPVLLVRNIFSVPALTRTSSHAALIFELATLASQHIFPAFAYSSYSMTLALASHPEVDGWDADVIAEDSWPPNFGCKIARALMHENA